MAHEDVKIRETTVLAGPYKKSTQIIISYFSNLIFVIITQTGQIGAYITSDSQTMDSKTLLGDRMNLLPNVYANEIVSSALLAVDLALIHIV